MYNLKFKLENVDEVFDHLSDMKNYLKLPKKTTVFEYAKAKNLKIYFKDLSVTDGYWQLFYHYKSNVGV